VLPVIRIGLSPMGRQWIIITISTFGCLYSCKYFRRVQEKRES